MKKLLASLMIVLLSTNVFAASVQEVGALQNAFETLELDLQVNWDQKDPVTKKEALDKFESAIQDLADQGLTGKELIDYVKTNVLDAQAAKDMEKLLGLVQNENLSIEDARNVVKNYVDKMHAQGANYHGRNGGLVTAVVGAAVLAVVLVAVLSAEYVYVGPTYTYDCYWGWGYDYYGYYVYDCWYY